MRLPVFSEEWGEEFVASMRGYIEALELSVDGDIDVETLSGEPFCGCGDCYERETYLMAVKLALEGHEAGRVRLAEVA